LRRRFARRNDGPYDFALAEQASYFGTSAELRNALFHDYQMKYYGVSW